MDPTGLKGAKLNAARAKNRRVEFKLVPCAPSTGDAGAGSGACAGTGAALEHVTDADQ